MNDESKTVSRREFLKIAGIAGATIGVGAGLGGLVAACGSGTTTTTAAAGDHHDGSPGDHDYRRCEARPPARVPKPAARSRSGSSTRSPARCRRSGWPAATASTNGTAETANGMVLGDGKNHPFDIQVVDSQSDTNRASQVTGDLINNAKVDLVMCAATGDTVNPVADMCEASGMPCLSIDVPVEVFVFQRGGAPDKPFKWTYNLFWGLTESRRHRVATCSTRFRPTRRSARCGPTTLRVTRTARSYGGSKDWPAKGYTFIDSGPYSEPSEDFTKQIALQEGRLRDHAGRDDRPGLDHLHQAVRAAGFQAEDHGGHHAHPVPDDAWKPSARSPTVSAACSGSIPTYPFKSSLTGETCQQMCDDFEKTKSMQWQQTIMHYAVFEWAIDCLQAARRTSTTRRSSSPGCRRRRWPTRSPVPSTTRCLCSGAPRIRR